MVCAGETFINVIVSAEAGPFNVDRLYITDNSIDVALVARKLRIFYLRTRHVYRQRRQKLNRNNNANLCTGIRIQYSNNLLNGETNERPDERHGGERCRQTIKKYKIVHVLRLLLNCIFLKFFSERCNVLDNLIYKLHKTVR